MTTIALFIALSLAVGAAARVVLGQRIVQRSLAVVFIGIASLCISGVAVTQMGTQTATVDIIAGLLLAGLTVASTVIGPSKFIKEITGVGWESPLMVLRYSVPALLTFLLPLFTAVTFYAAALYVALAALGGLFYWFSFGYLHSKGLHKAWYPEAVMGATVIGGMSVLIL